MKKTQSVLALCKMNKSVWEGEDETKFTDLVTLRANEVQDEHGQHANLDQVVVSCLAYLTDTNLIDTFPLFQKLSLLILKSYGLINRHFPKRIIFQFPFRIIWTKKFWQSFLSSVISLKRLVKIRHHVQRHLRPIKNW